MWRRVLCIVTLWVLAIVGVVRGDTLIMNDGTQIKGSVMKNGERYWVEKEDGQTMFVQVADVKQWIRSDAATASGAPAGTSAKFAQVKEKVSRVVTAQAAAALWQEFLDTKPADLDAGLAKIELAKWQKLAADQAELISGKWVSGPERKDIVEKATALYVEASELSRSNKELLAIKKLEEAVKIYPNFYEANSVLGLLSAASKKEDDALKYWAVCLKLRPSAVDALNNLGVMLAVRDRWEEGIGDLRKAAEIEDSLVVAANLNKAMHLLPRAAAGSAWAKAAQGPADLLAAKYGLTAVPDWRLVHYRFMPPGSNKAERMAGMISGSGFVVSADGMIVTNRHVVHGTAAIWVVVGDKRLEGQVVKEDAAQDLALVKLKTPQKLEMVELAKADTPAEGAQCYAVGFPMADRLGITLKVTQGIVSGSSKVPGGADILIDAKVNPGNSGGPLVDSHGQVIGVVSMKSETTVLEDSYGMAISIGKVRSFLTANKVAFKVGDETKGLSAEEVVAKVKAGTVCILGQVR